MESVILFCNVNVQHFFQLFLQFQRYELMRRRVTSSHHSESVACGLNYSLCVGPCWNFSDRSAMRNENFDVPMIYWTSFRVFSAGAF